MDGSDQLSHSRIRTSAAASQGGDKQLGLWDQLELKGWDLESRLYFGFNSKRITWSVIPDNAGGANKKEAKNKGNKKSQ